MYTPINEGTGSYLGVPFGLGTTAEHLASAPQITPISGKIVMVMTGASTPKQIGDRLAQRTIELTNPQFKFANLCIAAKDLNDWLTTAVWTSAMNNLTSKGLTADQVQILLIQNDDLAEPTTVFPTRALLLEEKFKEVIDYHLVKFPNLKQIFIMGRTTTAWSANTKHQEPKGYYNGWACKFVTEDSVSGEYPIWVCDSIYPYTDGDIPKADGLHVLQTDYKTDGVHLSNSGKAKVGDYVFEQLKDNPVSSEYFY